MIALLFIFTMFLVTSSVLAFEVPDLKTPESFIVDSETGEYFISNINGSPVEKDNNGFITKLRSDGTVMAKEFIKAGRSGVALNAPKGMAIIGHVLYVTDIDIVRGFNKKTGESLHTIDLIGLGAKFLNDLAADEEGNLYVSDTSVFVDAEASPAIFKIETQNDHRARVFSRDPLLAYPNGVVIHPKTKKLVVNTWGAGRILEVGEDGRAMMLAAHPAWKDLDGLDYDAAGNLYVSSFTGGTIYRIAPDRSISEVASGLKTPADISVDRKGNRLLIPLFTGDAATTIALTP